MDIKFFVIFSLASTVLLTLVLDQQKEAGKILLEEKKAEYQERVERENASKNS